MRKITTTRFGEIEIAKDKLICFADGLPAFEDEREFALLIVGDDSPYIFMQSASTPLLAFLLTNPYLFFPDYEFTLNDTTIAELGVDNQDDLEIYVLVTVPGGDIRHPTANLLAPVVINKNTGAAQQVVLENTKYHTKHPLFDAEKAEKAAKAAEGK